jgi:hypothetical protein
MGYLGTPIDTRNQFQSLQGKRFNGDGSTTDFTLDVAPGNVLDIEVFVGNVRQDPNSAYTLSGTTLSFTGAPPSGTNNIYVVHQAKSVGTIDVPALGVSTASLQANSVTGAKLNTDIISAQTALAETPADTDEFLVSDAGTIKRIDFSHIKSVAGSIYFSARRGNTGQSVSNDTYTVIQMDTEMEDSGSVFNPSTYKFTPGVVGKYFVFAQVAFSVTNGDDWDQGTVILDKNDAGYVDTSFKNSMAYINRRSSGSSTSSFYASQIIDMDADDTVRVLFQGNWSGASSSQTVGYGKSYFGGFRIA